MISNKNIKLFLIKDIEKIIEIKKNYKESKKNIIPYHYNNFFRNKY